MIDAINVSIFLYSGVGSILKIGAKTTWGFGDGSPGTGIGGQSPPEAVDFRLRTDKIQTPGDEPNYF